MLKLSKSYKTKQEKSWLDKIIKMALTIRQQHNLRSKANGK